MTWARQVCDNADAIRNAGQRWSFLFDLLVCLDLGCEMLILCSRLLIFMVLVGSSNSWPLSLLGMYVGSQQEKDIHSAPSSIVCGL